MKNCQTVWIYVHYQAPHFVGPDLGPEMFVKVNFIYQNSIFRKYCVSFASV